MPTYEFECRACGKQARLIMTFAEFDRGAPPCPNCGLPTLRRRVSRVRVIRSEGSRLESLSDDPSIDGLATEDPRALGQLMRRMGEESGEGLDPELREVVERLERGESAADIDRSMPDTNAGVD